MIPLSLIIKNTNNTNIFQDSALYLLAIFGRRLPLLAERARYLFQCGVNNQVDYHILTFFLIIFPSAVRLQPGGGFLSLD